MKFNLIRKDLEKTDYFPEIKYDLQLIYINGLGILEKLLNEFEEKCPVLNSVITKKFEDEVNTLSEKHELRKYSIGEWVIEYHNLYRRLFGIWKKFYQPLQLDDPIVESQISCLLLSHILLCSDTDFEFDDSNFLEKFLKIKT
jgi:hypothetical protein